MGASGCAGASACPSGVGCDPKGEGKGCHGGGLGCAYRRLPKIEVGVQAWLRGEGFINPNLDTKASNKSDVLQRIRVHAKATWGHLSVFGQVQDARVWGFERSTLTNEGNLDLHQGYFQWQAQNPAKRYKTYLRIGRQEIDFGRQRMIGSLQWDVNARSFDAMRLHSENRHFDVDAAWMVLRGRGSVSVVNPADPTNPTSMKSSGTHVGALRIGVHPARWFHAEATTLLNHDDRGQKATSNDIGDAGLRIFAKNLHGFDYDLEGHAQFGDRNGVAHQAWAAAGIVQYLYGVDRHFLNPGMRLGYSIASGDKSTKPNKSQEFFDFYPSNHLHYGIMDYFGWRNLRQLEATAVLAAKGGRKGRLDVSYRFNQLHEASGRWTNALGNLVGADPNNKSNTLGHEIDVQFTVTPFKPVFVQAGYGAFIPTGAGRRLTGAANSGVQHNLFLWFVYNL